jgi:nanoRNase/pAp phosphatase (c-di-AMP/oligoRNAs hydrolase)
MDSQILEKIKELIVQNESIGIAVGKNPGIDEMAAALSLYLSLSGASKKATVICSTEPIVEVSSLVGIDKVKKSFEGGKEGDLTVTFPYKEGEIEKISYTLEEGKLNILVKAGESGLSFNEKDIEFKREGSAPGLVFVVGTPRISDLGTAFDMEVLKDSKVINIDYKSENQGFGDIPLIGKNASSVSELMSNFISSLGFEMDVDVASNLLTGISAATANFQSESTSPLAFETAAFLLKKGAVRKTMDMPMSDIQEDAFFSPKPKSNAAAFAKGFGEPKEEKKSEIKMDENNPPDDWLAPKIYKGSTNV